MTSSRESIYATLFAVINQALEPLSFKTSSRRTRLVSDVPAIDQPAFFQKQIKEEAISLKAPAPPNYWLIDLDIIIYAFAGPEADAVSSTVLNDAVDALEVVFPPPPFAQTLGLAGIIDVRINGVVEYGEGNLTGQGIAIVPIRIKTN